MKALILAGGRGKRLSDIFDSTNKCMFQIGGKPVLEYNLERAAETPEIEDIVIVVGYRAEAIINRYGLQFQGKKIAYAIQTDQKGLVHAIESARDKLGQDDFFLLLGDEVLINSRHKEMIKKFYGEGAFALCGVLSQKNPGKISRTYTVLTDNDGRILRLVEKPKKALNDLQGTGHCVFRNAILKYIERTPIHWERGEKELPDLIQCAVDDGQIVKIFNICSEYTNINSEEYLKEAQKLFNT